MGALTSRQNADVEETDISANHAYRYPPKSGNYFGTHFIMGGERFDTPQPEAYLFGENADLNFLGSRPTVFPYPPPQSIEPTRTLKSLVNIRKESVRFVKSVDTVDTVALHKAHAQQQHLATITADGSGGKLSPSSAAASPLAVSLPVPPTTSAAYNIEFVYDADVKCAVTIYYFCTEEVTSHGCSYVSREPSLTSETFHCSSGINQVFSQTSHAFRPHLFADDDLYYHSDRDILPVVIHCVVDEGTDEPKQSHTTICVVDHHTDGTYALRALKQKIFVDGLCYLLQEIYGIENKSNMHNQKISAMDEDTDDNGSECVICMCDTRDTLILPCRHLCLCNSCADSLRYQANNCPICRAPFRALLQIKAVRRKGALGGLSGVYAGGGGVGGGGISSATVAAAAVAPAQSIIPATGGISLQQQQQQQQIDSIPAGYVAVSLIEALNGPNQSRLCDTKIEELTVALDAETTAADSGGGTATRRKTKDTTTTGTAAGASAATVDAKPKTGSSSCSSGGAHRISKSAATAKQQHQQLQLQQQQLRDTLKIVNEKLASTALNDALGNEADEDSDAEKMSPLLDQRQQLQSRIAEQIAADASALPLELDAIKVALVAGGRSDGDEFNGIGDVLGAISADNSSTNNKSTECLTALSTSSSDASVPKPVMTGAAVATSAATNTVTTATTTAATSGTAPMALKEENRSLPDSPVSGNSTISTRSSSDASYSSGSSTRQLLATSSGNGTQLQQQQQQQHQQQHSSEGIALMLLDGSAAASSTAASGTSAVHV